MTPDAFLKLRAAIRSVLIDPSDIESFDVRTHPDGTLDVYLRDRCIHVTDSQLRYASHNDAWDVLAAGTLTRLRNRHSIDPERTYTVTELHSEISTTLDRLLSCSHPESHDTLHEKLDETLKYLHPNARAAARAHLLALALLDHLKPAPLAPLSIKRMTNG